MSGARAMAPAARWKAEIQAMCSGQGVPFHPSGEPDQTRPDQDLEWKEFGSSAAALCCILLC